MGSREDRIERLTRERRSDGKRKQAVALATVVELVSTGQAVTFASVQRGARVSSWFVYNNPQVRGAIEAARTVARTVAASPAPAPAGLRADLLLARDEVRQLREERDRLRTRVRRDLGNTLEHRDRDALIEQVHELERQRNVLHAELHTARVELEQARGDGLILRDELDAARAALKRMMRDAARPPA
jgi:hypothetical protein